MIGTITVDIPPEFDVGPLTVAWHGLTIAIGILLGGLLAARLARNRGLDPAPLQTMGVIVMASAIVGGRVFYLIEHGQFLQPDEWLGTRGFTFYGGFIAAAASLALYLRRTGHSIAYLDLAAVALPLGVAVGRIGDVINGEHYGPQTDFFLAVRNAHPDALTPDPSVAFHNGGLYEVLLSLAILAIVWPLRERLRIPGAMSWLVIGLYGAGRFVEFFARDDSENVALGVNGAQWTSLALLVVGLAGAAVTIGRVRFRTRAA